LNISKNFCKKKKIDDNHRGIILAKKEKNLKNIYKEMWILSEKIEKLSLTGRYDVDMLLSSLHTQLDQLNYFYDYLVSSSPDKDPNKTFYSLKTNPKEHQLIYVVLGRGYPKELFDAHWCYLLKYCGTKLLVIPTTSIKTTSSSEEKKYYSDIYEESGNICRLRFDEMRTIDKMRVITYKPFKDIKTDRSEIEESLKIFLGIQEKTIDKK